MSELPKKRFFVNIFVKNKLSYKATSQLQNSTDRSQVVGFRRLTHRSMRQGPYFSAHFESAPYDKFENLWNPFSENGSKMWPQIAWIRIVPQEQIAPLRLSEKIKVQIY